MLSALNNKLYSPHIYVQYILHAILLFAMIKQGDLFSQRPPPFVSVASQPSFPSRTRQTEDEILNIRDEKDYNFLSKEPLDESAPPTTWRDFRHPRLRRFSRHQEKVRWVKCEGGGREGAVFQAFFGDYGPYAVKIVRNGHLTLL